MPWHVYLVRCADGSLYCGITKDLAARIASHNVGTGAKYIVPARRPVTLAYSEIHDTKSSALKREAAIKGLSKKSKEALLES